MLGNIISKTAEDWHYVQINIVADLSSGEPENREPDRHGPWEWYSLDKLPSPLGFGIKEALDAMKTGVVWQGTIRI